VGGLSGIHQFVRVGKLAMVGAGAMVALDVPPFCTVWETAPDRGLKHRGMKRRHYSQPTIDALKRPTATFSFPRKQSSKPSSAIKPGKKDQAEVRELADFIQASARGSAGLE